MKSFIVLFCVSIEDLNYDRCYGIRNMLKVDMNRRLEIKDIGDILKYGKMLVIFKKGNMGGKYELLEFGRKG